jgi:hypothetical protein
MDEVRELLRKHSQGKWVKPQGHGGFVIGAPLGEPWGCEVTGFGSDTKRYSSNVHSGGKPRFQGWVNFLNKETGKTQILAMGTGKMSQLIADIDAGSSQAWYKWERLETGQKRTDVSYRLDREDSIPDKEYEQLLHKPLWDLEFEAFAGEDGEKEPGYANPQLETWSGGGTKQSTGAAPPPPPPSPDANGLPLTPHQAHDLWKDFEPLPSEAQQKAWGELHQKLGIKKLGELTQSRLTEALDISFAIRQDLANTATAASPPPPPPPAGPMAQDEFSGTQRSVWDDGDGA